MKVTLEEYQRRVRWPLAKKIAWALRQIRIWYEVSDGRVYVSFSGGKDSTVLLHLVRSLYPDVPAVFCNTGLEFPEIVDFVRSTPNVTTLRPAKTFRKVIQDHGWPVISKDQAVAINRYRHTKDPEQKRRRLEGFPNGPKGMISKKWRFLIEAPFEISDECCRVMKKTPVRKYVKSTSRYGMEGTMAADSRMRKTVYLRQGCNSFGATRPVSRPLSIWTEDDVWGYVRDHKVAYSPIYDMGYKRTGCVFCMFGVHLERPPNRFQLLQKTHPRLHTYCMEKLGLRKVLEFIGVAHECDQLGMQQTMLVPLDGTEPRGSTGVHRHAPIQGRRQHQRRGRRNPN